MQLIRVFDVEHYTVYPKKYAHGFALLCFVVVIHWLIFPYPSGLLHWHSGNLTIAPVPAKQSWWIWINTSCEFIKNDCITTTKQSTTKSCAYFLGYTVVAEQTGRGEVSDAVPIWPPQSVAVALNCGHPTQWHYTQCGPAVAVMFSSCWHEKQKSLQLRRTRRRKRNENIKSPQTGVTW